MSSSHQVRVSDIERPYMATEAVRQRMATLRALALSAGETVVDIGCGNGLLTFDMAFDVGANGRVIGIDNNPEMLDHAGSRCASFKQVSLKKATAEDLPLPDEFCDAAACAQVLLHVAEPATAIHEMRRILKPGGRLAIVETDWRSVVLNTSDETLTRRIFDAWDGAVANPNLPVRLGPMLRAHGFAALRIEAVPILDTSYSDGSFSVNSIEGFAEAARKRGAIQQREAEWWLEDLRRKGEAGAYFFSVTRFLFAATQI